MEAEFGLLLLLLQASHGVVTHCDGRQDGAQCYGAVGGTVFIRLVDTTPSRFEIQNSKTRILRWKNNTSVENENRSFFYNSNGTFRINNLHKNHSDKYSLEIQNSDGILVRKWTLHLSIQAPLSSVRLVKNCLSQGEMRVSCIYEGGDSPQYNWTLDGHTLTQDKLFSVKNETGIIILRQDVSGLLGCTVSNHVSSVSTDMSISTCGFIFNNCTLSNGTHISQWVFAANKTLCVEPTTVPDTTAGKRTESVTLSTNITSSNQTVTPSRGDPWFISSLPLMAGVLSALLLLLVLGVAVVCVQKKNKINIKEEEDEQELTYADVRVMQRRQVQQRDEEEVEYGQVRISERPRRAVERTTDDCVYAQVFVKNPRGQLY